MDQIWCVPISIPESHPVIIGAAESSRLANAHDPHHNQLPPKYDILEVNDYLMAGLVVSPIDKWFMGPVPRFLPQDLGVPGDECALTAAIQRARVVINNPAQMAWPSVS